MEDIWLYTGLECPKNSTLFGSHLKIVGWVVLETSPNASNQDTPTLTIEVKKKIGDQSLYNQGGGSFQELEVGKQYNTFCLSALDIVRREEISLKRNKRIIFNVAGVLDFTSHQENKESIELRLVSKIKNLKSFSHIGSVSYLSGGKLKAGPEQILPEETYDNVLMLNFWHQSPIKDQVSCISKCETTVSNVVNYTCATTSLISPDLKNAWPDSYKSEYSRGTALTMLKEEACDLSYNCELTLNENHHCKVFFGNSKYLPKRDNALITHIYNTPHRIVLKGELWSEQPFNRRLFLSSSSSFLELHENIKQENYQLTFYEEELDYLQFGTIPWSVLNRFKLEVTPEILGIVPGNLKLWYSFDNAQINPFPASINLFINRLINDELSKRHDNRLGKRDRAYRALSNYGLSKSKDLNKEQIFHDKPYKSQRGKVLAHFHNLKATEGAPRVLFNIIQNIAFNALTITSAEEGELCVELKEKQSAPIILDHLKIDTLTKSTYQKTFLDYFKIIKREEPELVIANSIDSFPVIDVATRLNIPTIWIIHESLMPCTAYPQHDLFVRKRFIKALSKTSKTVFVSSETRDMYLGVLNKENTAVIPNGLDLDLFLSKFDGIDRLSKRVEISKLGLDINERDIVFLSVGTTAERKGQDRTLREFSIFAKKRPDLEWKFLIVGGRDIPFLKTLEALIDSYNLRKNVIVIPETSEIHQFYAIADYFILNSREESSPLVVLEAMASRLPIFSTNVFGLKEILFHKKNALLFNGENEGELADLLAESLKNPQILQIIKEKAYNLVCKSHSLEDSLKKYQALFEEFYSSSQK